MSAPRGSVEHLFYDGSCGLCHRAVRFVLARDGDGSRFRFAPLGGPTFQRLVPAQERARLADSVVVLDLQGRVLQRSDAALHVLRRIGGAWGVVGATARICPRGLRDRLYDVVARVRRRLAARPDQACPLVPPDLRARFDP